MLIYILENDAADGDRLKKHLLDLNTRDDVIDIRLFDQPEDFLRELKSNRPDMAFIRVGRIGLNGLTVARKIRELDHLTKIVLISNYRDYAIYAYDVQAIDYLLEPLEIDRLRQTLQKAKELPGWLAV